jgi:nucleoside-diphosphate-sugar epimerase
VTINRLVDLVEQVAGVKLRRVYDTTAPVGVNGRSSDNALISELLGWEPTTPLIEGIARTYAWVYDQLAPRERGSGKTPRSAGRALPAK